MSIRAKLIVGVLFVSLFVGGMDLLFVQQAHDAALDAVAVEALATAGHNFSNLELQDTAKLGSALDVARSRPDWAGLFQSRDRAGLFAATKPLYDTLERNHSITHWYFITPEPDRRVFLRIHNREKYDDIVDRRTLLKAVRTKKRSAGLELGKTAFALRVVEPYYAGGRLDGGTLVGYMEMGEEIDHFLDLMKSATGDEFGLLLDKSALDKATWQDVLRQKGLSDDWDARAHYVLAATTDPAFERVMDYRRPAADIPDEGVVLGVYEEREETESVPASATVTEIQGLVPIRDVDGKHIGALFVERDISGMVESLRQERYRVLVSTGAVAAGMVLLILLMLNTLVFRRLRVLLESLGAASGRLEAGDLDASELRGSEGDDEFAQATRSVNDFLRAVSDRLKSSSKGE